MPPATATNGTDGKSGTNEANERTRHDTRRTHRPLQPLYQRLQAAGKLNDDRMRELPAMTNDTTIRNLIRDTLADLRTAVNTADVCDGAAAELAYDLANSTDDDDDDTSDEENEAQS